MKKRKRVPEADRVWHAMARGVRKSPLFLSDQDRTEFLQKMDDALERGGLCLLGYCLMDNHYHLLLKGAKDALSKFFQYVNSRYAKGFNRRDRLCGHLFEGPYRAYRAKSPWWIIQKSVYIHMNPVEARIAKNPIDYRWSSLKAYFGGIQELRNLYPDQVLQLVSTERREQRGRYHDLLRMAVGHVLQGRKFTQAVISRQVNPKLSQAEEVRLQVEDVMILRQKLEELLMEHPSVRVELEHPVAMLTSYLSRRWNIATAPVVAVVLGCSESLVKKFRRIGLSKLTEIPILRARLPLIRKSLFEKPFTQGNPPS